MRVLLAQRQPFGQGVDDGLPVARYGYGNAGGFGDGAVFADQDVEHDAVDGVVLAVEGHRADYVAALPEPVDAAFALLMASGVPGEVVVHDGRERFLQVDTLGQAVGGDEHVERRRAR